MYFATVFSSVFCFSLRGAKMILKHFQSLTLQGKIYILSADSEKFKNRPSNKEKKIFQEHKETLDHNNPRDLIDFYMLEMDKDTTGEFTEDNLVMNVVDLFAAGRRI